MSDKKEEPIIHVIAVVIAAIVIAMLLRSC